MMKNTAWKIPLIITVGIIAVVLACTFGVQGSQNHAISMEEHAERS